MLHPINPVRRVDRPAAAALCLAWLACATLGSPARGEAEPGDENPPSAPAEPAAETPPRPPRAGTVFEHPPVNMAAFTREYRPLRVLGIAGSTDDAATAVERRLEQVIAEPWDFSECPLQDVVAHLRGALDVQVVLDVRACEAQGIDLDTPVSCQARDTTARFALRGLLDSVGMTWTIAEGVLVITTEEEAAAKPVIRVYPLPWGVAERRPAAAQELVETLQAVVTPANWDVVGGPASIRVVESDGELLLVVGQTCSAHDTITALLRTLHARVWAEFGDPAAPWEKRRPVIRIHHLADGAARADVVRKLKDLCNASLGDAADPAATITDIGASIAVQSRSPEFHALAGQVIVAVGGVDAAPAERPAVVFGRTGIEPPAEPPGAAE